MKKIVAAVLTICALSFAGIAIADEAPKKESTAPTPATDTTPAPAPTTAPAK